MPDLNVTSTRFELTREGHTAFLEYRQRNNILHLIHTEVPLELRGNGHGSELVRSALDWAQQRHLKIHPFCPFVAAYWKRHPEFSGLVAEQS